MSVLSLPTSIGDAVDRITILEIKQTRFTAAAQKKNVGRELMLISRALFKAVERTSQLDALSADLKAINRELWDVEENIRDCERRREFGTEFVNLARSVYRLNDKRAGVKRKINMLFGSEIIEEKAYGKSTLKEGP